MVYESDSSCSSFELMQPQSNGCAQCLQSKKTIKTLRSKVLELEEKLRASMASNQKYVQRICRLEGESKTIDQTLDQKPAKMAEVDPPKRADQERFEESKEPTVAAKKIKKRKPRKRKTQQVTAAQQEEDDFLNECINEVVNQRLVVEKRE